MVNVSYMTLNRIFEEAVKKDKSLLAGATRNIHCTLSAGRSWSDEQLLDKLHSLGFTGLDRSQLDDLTRLHPSAQQLAVSLIDTAAHPIDGKEVDWVWIALVCLWERWFPDRPNFEMIDDRMQAGYAQLASGERDNALQSWLDAWQGVRELFRVFQYDSIAAFDDVFGGTQALFNWIQDFSDQLGDSSEGDHRFSHAWLDLCKFVLSLEMKPAADPYLLEFFASNLTECCRQLSLDESAELRGIYANRLDDVVAALDKPYDGRLPATVLRAAQSLREEITPRLIELIRRDTAAVRANAYAPTEGALLAFMLLVEFKSPAALPAIVESLSLPGEGVFELFGDAIHEIMPSYLANTAYDQLDLIDRLIDDRSLNEYVRWTAAETFVPMICQGRISREAAAERLIAHLQTACDNADGEIAGPLVSELSSFAVEPGLKAIQRAFELKLVDEMLIRESDIKDAIEGGEAYIQKTLDRCHRSEFEDTVEELSSWHCYRKRTEREEEAGDTWDDEDEADDYLDDEYDGPAPGSIPVGTIVNTAPRVGRNEPCPCGSGKKYKKCCGSRT